jgi:glycosyltransferase involved in cell wall biosynthesis
MQSIRPSVVQPVSIVATVLNEAEDIARGVSSLLAQEPSATEVIVVDGGSTDGTWEWLAEMQTKDPRLVAIRDETCSLKYSPGPVSRGRNVAIAAARTATIATADAGCTYATDWLLNLTAPLVAGKAEYALGGSCLDPVEYTVWDVASAPFFSVKLGRNEPTKSCTARSMAFTKALWTRIGGFPEAVLVGEDTLYDRDARRLTPPAFIDNAKAIYSPRNSFRSACRQMARYAVSDGLSRVRMARLFRNTARCLLQVLALASLPWSVIPFVLVLALELWYAFHRDWKFLPHFGMKAVLARFVFSVAVPWVVATNHVYGLFSTKQQTNKQNQG